MSLRQKKYFKPWIGILIASFVYFFFLPALAKGEVKKQGEVIRYRIKNLGMNTGEATLAFKGVQKINGRDVYVIVFTAKAVNFFDEEKIYADAQTLYPLGVERDLNIFGKKEKITESYDAQKGVIKVTKSARGQTTEQIIHKRGVIDNIYCFIYRQRMSGRFQPGDSFLIHLPTKDVTIKLVKKTQVAAAGRKFDAYYMESDPPQYKVWFDTGAKKIPLRINGSAGLGSTAMIMTEYRNETTR